MNPEALNVLLMMSAALNNVITHPSTVLGFPLSAVLRYEVVAVTDEKDKPIMIDDPNGGTEKVQQISGLITYRDGGVIELTDEQRKNFQPLWNLKMKIDNALIGIASASYDQMFPPPTIANGASS